MLHSRPSPPPINCLEECENMNKWGGALIVFLAILLTAGVVFAGTRGSIADKGGCPNISSDNSSASDDSAHSADKQAERGCVDSGGSPTPPAATPTPTLEPTPEATPTPTATASDTPTPT